MENNLLSTSLKSEVLRFLAVGGVGFIVDVGLFNLIMLQISPEKSSPIVLLVKLCSMLLAISFTYFANSYWTFAGRNGSKPTWRQFGKFMIVNLAGSSIMMLCLGISHYVFLFQSLEADNLSANVVGVILATIFRFIANHFWVFPLVNK